MLTKETLMYWTPESLIDEVIRLQKSNEEKDREIENMKTAHQRQVNEFEKRLDNLRKRVAKDPYGQNGDLFSDFANMFGRAPRR